ncbi:MAG: 1-deoxy-D-xylulose-5-phosphate reductoisomerase [Candidatus Marinimicrobia bacterium CG08_land_8_20_14_0_20_45_22]|nr:MAG: 1-deoxy-D-xylulose-5-phosphate reductoisomerase [Candidatus Marinimicrobia bacterium CG08_land_8_20_14_0_20_45_22]
MTSEIDKKRLTLLGSTGSIGQNTLRIVSTKPELFEIVYLSAGKNAGLLIDQAKQFHPKAVAIADETQFRTVETALKSDGIEVLHGREGIYELAERADVDLVVNAIVGVEGLMPSYRAISAGKDIALSNKESLVMAGDIIYRLLAEKKARLFPIDSEHSAIWQCLQGEKPETVQRVILTGSGGPFRELPLENFASITPESALKHPTWKMGKKITIDSATLMNKGLEIIEARWLFNLRPEQIDVVIHPQSIIHSMVEFIDGSVKAQLGVPDMKLPIQYALNFPERLALRWEYLDFGKINQLTFELPDIRKFPAIRLAYETLKRGGTASAILNVVNELSVYAFLEHRIGFTDITDLVEKALGFLPIVDHPTISDVLRTVEFGMEFVEKQIHSK